MAGIFGIANHPEASSNGYSCLYALQHLGLNSAGMAATNGVKIHSHFGFGHVADVFDERAIEQLSGTFAIGATNFSSASSNQPVVHCSPNGHIALCFSGALTNRRRLIEEFRSNRLIIDHDASDAEVILRRFLCRQRRGPVEELREVFSALEGAISLAMIYGKTMVGYRDPYGVWPLCLGQLGEAYVLASESCAFDLIGARFISEIEPGQAVFIREDGFKNKEIFPPLQAARCLRLMVCGSRPDSNPFGLSVQKSRFAAGMKLAVEFPTTADIVVGIPDGGVTAALGYSKQSGIRFAMGMVRSHYVDDYTIARNPQIPINFIGPLKFNTVKERVQGQRVVLIDDEIHSSNTLKHAVWQMRRAGASEVHARIASPRRMFPCHYGGPGGRNLSTKTTEQMREDIFANSLAFLSLEGLKTSNLADPRTWCTACYTGKYPIEFQW